MMRKVTVSRIAFKPPRLLPPYGGFFVVKTKVRKLPAKRRKKQKYRPSKLSETNIQRGKYYLTDEDRLFYAYSNNKEGKLTEIICVSYEILVGEEWITLVRYDNEHGYLHRHTTISLSDRRDVVSTDNVKRRGKLQGWYTWCHNDIRKNYLIYKRQFNKRSRS